MNEASYLQLLDMVEQAIRRAADDSLGQLAEELRSGAIPRETIEAALQQFDGVFYETLAGAYSQVLGTSMGVQSIKALEVGGLKLSTAMYGHGKAVTEEVLGIITRHAKGMQSARALAMEIYEGYGFRDPAAEPLKLSPRNPKLPKYLREVLRDDDARTAMQRIISRAQATEIKTPNLRAAYVQAIDEFEKGAGADRLAKVLDVAANERMRYFANRIAQTELHRAYSDQQAREFMADKSIEVVQVKMSATHPKVDICDMHSSLNKYGLGAGCYPKPLAPKPPFHPHCLPGDALITAAGRISAVSKRWFDGNIVVITTASGKRLSATVNHPILTPRGWIGAGVLDVGDEVISRVDAVPVRGNAIVHDDHQDVPSSIAEIADAFSRSGKVTSTEVPLSAENFHGDGMAGQVAVIWADSELWNGIDAATSQIGNDKFLEFTQSAFAGLFSKRISDLGDETPGCSTDGGMGAGSEGETFCSGHSSHSYFSGLASVAQVDISHGKATGYDVTGDAELARQIKNGTTGSVFADKVVDVKRDVVFSGHVFNLETEHGHYTANGIITHNCRCILQPRWDLKAAAARDRAKAEQAFLIEAGDKDGAKIMGSRAKWIAAKNGTPVEEILNAGKGPMYRLARVGDED